jgi:catechol 2,3-dioxygenase-like lactoylglutathione lyase family enzyme
MAVQLNHTIVASHDPAASAAFLAEVLGLAAPRRFAHFHVVELANGVSLDFDQAAGDDFTRQHYAFLITEEEFDEIHARVRARDIPIYADPGASHPGGINTDGGGRGFYFADPSGHWLEVLTRPYGSS